MRVFDRLGGRPDVLGRPPGIERLAWFHDLVQALPLDVGHREVMLSIHLARIVHRDDMRMTQVARGIGLGKKRPDLFNTRQLAF